jgi:hypothetical protein
VVLDLAAFADHLNMDAPPDEGSRDHTEMTRALDTAVGEVTRMTGWVDDAPATALITVWWDRILHLPFARLSRIVAVRDVTGGTVIPYRVDPLAGLVELTVPAEPGVWQIDVVGSPWPAALTTAALDLAAHVYDTQRIATAPVSDTDTPAPSFALPNRVLELITPYLLPGMA